MCKMKKKNALMYHLPSKCSVKKLCKTIEGKPIHSLIDTLSKVL